MSAAMLSGSVIHTLKDRWHAVHKAKHSTSYQMLFTRVPSMIVVLGSDSGTEIR